MIGGALPALARLGDWLYLEHWYFGGRRQRRPCRYPLNQMIRMVRPLSTPRELSAIPPSSGRIARAIVAGGAAFGVAALLAAAALWFHYGTAVFFETIASGISACF